MSGVGHHRRIELRNGRKAELFPGDEIVVCYGNRYAPDQFEATVPDDLGQCHLVAAGGLASRCLTRHASAHEATIIEPVGLLADADCRPVNLARWSLQPVATDHRPPTVAVLGTAMNAGKTSTAASLVHGLAGAGLRGVPPRSPAPERVGISG